MRYGKLLAASGVLVVSLGLAAVGFGPAVRSRLEAKAARYGATVEVERVEPLWLGVRLSGVTVRFSEMPSLQARLDGTLAALAGRPVEPFDADRATERLDELRLGIAA